jgi:hypothetical protein
MCPFGDGDINSMILAYDPTLADRPQFPCLVGEIQGDGTLIGLTASSNHKIGIGLEPKMKLTGEKDGVSHVPILTHSGGLCPVSTAISAVSNPRIRIVRIRWNGLAVALICGAFNPSGLVTRTPPLTVLKMRGLMVAIEFRARMRVFNVH